MIVGDVIDESIENPAVVLVPAPAQLALDVRELLIYLQEVIVEQLLMMSWVLAGDAVEDGVEVLLAEGAARDQGLDEDLVPVGELGHVCRTGSRDEP